MGSVAFPPGCGGRDGSILGSSPARLGATVDEPLKLPAGTSAASSTKTNNTT